MTVYQIEKVKIFEKVDDEKYDFHVDLEVNDLRAMKNRNKEKVQISYPLDECEIVTEIDTNLNYSNYT